MEAVSGSAGVKLDWEATWRNQIRRLAQRRTTGPHRKSSQMNGQDQDAELIRLMRETPLAEDEPQTLRMVK